MPSPIAWGIIAGLMRFVPYVGAYLAAALPLLIAAAIDPGWTTFMLVLVLFVVGELIMGQVVEPLVFGHGTGVTPIAVIASTVFWTWLWGPLGLLARHADDRLPRRARPPRRGSRVPRRAAGR